jgi:predicted ATPase
LTGADSSTLSLLVTIMASSHGNYINHLLLIAAYRDSEVNDDHPLTKTLAALKGKDEEVVREICLSNLSENDVVNLLEDSFNKNQSMCYL